MEIALTLERHCIETETKKTYEHLLKKIFKKTVSDADKILLEDQIEGLKYILETVDFSYLRSTFPELSGNQEISLTLFLSEKENQIKIVMGDNVIEPKLKEIK